MGIQVDSGDAAERFRARARGFMAAVHKALQRVVIEVNREQVANLSGSGAGEAGSYPIPVRTGNLRRSADWGFLDEQTAFVTAGGAQAPYAFQVHEGLGTSSRYGRRPFQDRAAQDTDVAAIIGDTLEAELA